MSRLVSNLFFFVFAFVEVSCREERSRTQIPPGISPVSSLCSKVESTYPHAAKNDNGEVELVVDSLTLEVFPGKILENPLKLPNIESGRVYYFVIRRTFDGRVTLMSATNQCSIASPAPDSTSEKTKEKPTGNPKQQDLPRPPTLLGAGLFISRQM